MKPPTIKLTLTDYIAELQRELAMRQKVYQKQIDKKQLAPYTANKRFLIIRKLLATLEEMDRCGITMEQLNKELAKIKTLYRPQQGLLFNQIEKA